MRKAKHRHRWGMKTNLLLVLLFSPLILIAKETWVVEQIIESYPLKSGLAVLSIDYYDSDKPKTTHWTDTYTFKLKSSFFLDNDSVSNRNSSVSLFRKMDDWGLFKYDPKIRILREKTPYTPVSDYFVQDFLLSGCSLDSFSKQSVNVSNISIWVFSRE